jgi:hypothetical protein
VSAAAGAYTVVVLTPVVIDLSSSRLWLKVVLVVLIVWLGGGGAYQLVTGRFGGVGRFPVSYTPSKALLRFCGAVGVVFGVFAVILLLN